MAGQHARSFSLKLWERVVQMTCWTFVSTYVGTIPVTTTQHLIPQVANMTVTQRILISLLAGALQFVAGAGIAPHVGDPNTPDLIPNIILKRFGIPEGLQQPLEVGVDEVIQAALRAVKAKPGTEVTIEDVAKELVANREKPKP